MGQQSRIILIGTLLTLVAIKSHGQYIVWDGKLEAGHYFQKTGRQGLSKKDSEKNDLVSLIRIDSIGSTNRSWYAAILFRDTPPGQVDVELEFQNKKSIKTRGQRPLLSEIDMVNFGDNELIFPIDKTDIEAMINFDIVSIRINGVSFSPDKSLFKRLTKCLMY